MRHRLRPLALAALIPLILLGCGLLRFEVEQEDESTIEGAGLLGEVLGALDFTGLDDFQTSIDGELEDQGVAPGDLKHVQLIAFELQAEPDLAFVERLNVYVSADGVDEVRVASGEGFAPYPLSPGISRNRGSPVTLPIEVTDARRFHPPPALRLSPLRPYSAPVPARAASVAA